MPFKKGDPRARKAGSNGIRKRWAENREEMLLIAKKGSMAGASKGGTTVLKKRWKHDREKMLEISKKGFLKVLSDARRLKYENSRGEKMRSSDEVKLSEELLKYNIEYDYEKRLGFAIPDFTIGKVVIEVAGLPYDKYWARMEKKYSKYLAKGYKPIIWNTSKREDTPVPVLTSLTAVIQHIQRLFDEEA